MAEPKCNECGRTMEKWDTLGVYYCKRCSIIYDPKKDEYWHTDKQDKEEEE